MRALEYIIKARIAFDSTWLKLSNSLEVTSQYLSLARSSHLAELAAMCVKFGFIGVVLGSVLSSVMGIS